MEHISTSTFVVSHIVAGLAYLLAITVLWRKCRRQRAQGLAEISERQKTEEALRENQDNLTRAQALSNIMVTRVDMTGRWLEVSPWLCQILGYPEAELLKLRIQDVTCPEDAEADWEQYQRLQKSDLKAITSEKRFCRKDGSPLWFDVNVSLVNGAHGQPKYYLVFLRDITENKLAVQRLRAQAELLDLTQDAISVRDLAGRIVYWNRGAKKLYGWSFAEVEGHEANEFLSAPAAQLETCTNQTRTTGRWAGELEYRTRQGNKLVVESRWTLMKDAAGLPQSILVVETNITEKKLAETQLLRAQRMDTLGNLAGGVIHDLNNILAPILMSVGFVLERKHDEETQVLLKTIASSARRGAEIVQQLLSFGHGATQKMPVNPRHLAQQMVKIINETFPKSISVGVRIQPDPWLIKADPTQIHQILLNLCVNARDAMAQGGILNLSLSNTELEGAKLPSNAKPGKYVVFSVADTGPGIPDEIKEKIFEPFFTTKPPGMGTGLGLASVQTIVRNHDGFIDLQTEPGRGTRFNVYLPADLGATEAPAKTDASAPAPARGEGESILVVDDELAVCTTIQHVLQTAGYRVLIALDGQEAVKVYQRNPQDVQLVLLDHDMPFMNGAVALDELRKVNSQVKVISVTGTAPPKDGNVTADLLLPQIQKPFMPRQLLECVRTVLDAKSEQ